MRQIVVMAILAMSCVRAFGDRSIIVDPSYAYYKNRSVESIVEEIKANGYDEVRLCCTNESGIDGSLVKAFVDAGVRVWMLTFTNGVYSRVDLPKGWEAWRMKLRKKPDPAGFTMLCPNNLDYRAWKKQQVTAALRAHPFHGIDLAEPQMPAYPGPESEHYGCFCDACLEEFKRLYPGVTRFPDFEDPESEYFWKKNKDLYEKWVGFRVATVVNWLDDLVNGNGGIREKCPGVKIATWSLGLDVPDQLSKLREWQAMDAAAIVRRVKPDVHVIQTDWPDWIKDNLDPNYAAAYKPIFDSVRQVAPSIPIILQTDIGSKPNMRRDTHWIKAVETAARKMGYAGVFHYEYHLGEYIYSDPPTVVNACFDGNTIKLVFNKRLDPAQACNVSNYSLSSGRVDFARVDGNVIYLSVSGAMRGLVLTVSGLSDDASRRLYHDKPACVMPDPIEITIE